MTDSADMADDAKDIRAADKGLRKIRREARRTVRQIRKHNLLRRIAFMNGTLDAEDYHLQFFDAESGEAQIINVSHLYSYAMIVAQEARDSGNPNKQVAQEAFDLLNANFGQDLRAYQIRRDYLTDKTITEQQIVRKQEKFEAFQREQGIEAKALGALYERTKKAGLTEVDAAHQFQEDLQGRRFESLGRTARQAHKLAAELLAEQKPKPWERKQMTAWKHAVASQAAVIRQGSQQQAMAGPTVVADKGTSQQQALSMSLEAAVNGGLIDDDKAQSFARIFSEAHGERREAAIRDLDEEERAAFAAIAEHAQSLARPASNQPETYVSAMESMATAELMAISKARFAAASGTIDTARQEAEMLAEIEGLQSGLKARAGRHAKAYDGLKPDEKAEKQQLRNEFVADAMQFIGDLMLGGKAKTKAELEQAEVADALARVEEYSTARPAGRPPGTTPALSQLLKHGF